MLLISTLTSVQLFRVKFPQLNLAPFILSNLQEISSPQHNLLFYISGISVRGSKKQDARLTAAKWRVSQEPREPGWYTSFFRDVPQGTESP